MYVHLRFAVSSRAFAYVVGRCSKPNICAFIEQSTDPQHIYLVSMNSASSILLYHLIALTAQVLEYIDGGDLLNYIMQRGESGEIGLRKFPLRQGRRRRLVADRRL